MSYTMFECSKPAKSNRSAVWGGALVVALIRDRGVHPKQPGDLRIELLVGHVLESHRIAVGAGVLVPGPAPCFRPRSHINPVGCGTGLVPTAAVAAMLPGPNHAFRADWPMLLMFISSPSPLQQPAT